MQLPGHALAFGTRQHLTLPLPAKFRGEVRVGKHGSLPLARPRRCPGPVNYSAAPAMPGHMPGFAAAIANRGVSTFPEALHGPLIHRLRHLIPCHSCVATLTGENGRGSQSPIRSAGLVRTTPEYPSRHDLRLTTIRLRGLAGRRRSAGQRRIRPGAARRRSVSVPPEPGKQRKTLITSHRVYTRSGVHPRTQVLITGNQARQHPDLRRHQPDPSRGPSLSQRCSVERLHSFSPPMRTRLATQELRSRQAQLPARSPRR